MSHFCRSPRYSRLRPPFFFFFLQIQKSQSPHRPLEILCGIFRGFTADDMEEFLCSCPPPSSSRYYRLIDVLGEGGRFKSPASPACAPLLLCSAGLLRVMDELKSLSIRQGRLKGSDNANTRIFFFSPQEVKINSANSVNHTPKHTWKTQPGCILVSQLSENQSGADQRGHKNKEDRKLQKAGADWKTEQERRRNQTRCVTGEHHFPGDGPGSTGSLTTSKTTEMGRVNKTATWNKHQRAAGRKGRFNRHPTCLIITFY